MAVLESIRNDRGTQHQAAPARSNKLLVRDGVEKISKNPGDPASWGFMLQHRHNGL